jgi:hypothetical protein
VIHGAGNGVMTIASGALPLALFGAGGFGLRQGLLMAPARVVSASAPFVFDLLLARYGTASLASLADWYCGFRGADGTSVRKA